MLCESMSNGAKAVETPICKAGWNCGHDIANAYNDWVLCMRFVLKLRNIEETPAHKGNTPDQGVVIVIKRICQGQVHMHAQPLPLDHLGPRLCL